MLLEVQPGALLQSLRASAGLASEAEPSLYQMYSSAVLVF